MSAFQLLMIIADTINGGGYNFGKVRYPEQYKDQDANAILAMLGQRGMEITHVAPGERQVAIFLKKIV